MRPFLLLLFYLATIFSAAGAVSHSITLNRQISWDSHVEPGILPFKGEGHMEGFLPVTRFRVPVPPNIIPGSLVVEIGDEKWAPGEGCPEEVAAAGYRGIRYGLVHISKQVYAEIEVIPLRVNNGMVERMEAFSVTLAYQTMQDPILLKGASTAANFPAKSVLADGNWQKIAVSQTGVHQVSYSTLQAWGFPNPSRVSVFGFGGQMVPRQNNQHRPPDLPRVAVWHHDNAIYFFANGPVNWAWNSSLNMFTHTLHYYSERAYYFLTDKELTPNPVGLMPPGALEPTNVVSSFDDRVFHERELVNLINSGREWYGERFNVSDRLERTFDFSFPARDLLSPVKLHVSVVARSASASSFDFFINNPASSQLRLTLPPVSLHSIDGFYAQAQTGATALNSTLRDVRVTMRYNDQAQTSEGRLDFIIINTRSNLEMTGSQLLFRDVQSVGNGNVSRFILNNAPPQTRVWDVTDILAPVEMSASRSGNLLEFVAGSASLREYVAFNPAGQLPEPERVGSVNNQNLHGSPQVDYVIVAHEDFLALANQLAAIHQEHSGFSTLVVTQQQVFNEFSWGHRDPTAIRSLMRMLYTRAAGDASKAPRFLLLFGNGSYDNRSNNPATRSLIITYQSENSTHKTNTYVTDDFFGFLDDAEGADIRFDRLDIGIGRFPVRSVQDARVAVDKVRAYLQAQDAGAWRKRVTFAADDGDFNIHQRDADFMAQRVENNHPAFDVTKIYLDNYRKITTSTGKISPDAQNAINRAVNEGTLIFNYVGHGNQRYLAEERLVSQQSIRNWTNIRRLPLFVTATCEFSRFDDPAEVSAGEMVFLSPTGGAIALLSTTRVVFSSLNFQLNNAFFNHVFTPDANGNRPTFGDIIKNTKNSSGNSINRLNFTLLGDPGLTLGYPRYGVNTLTVNHSPVASSPPDTLKALSRAHVRAEIVDGSGARLTNFNGEVEITVFDKPLQVRTLGNDGATPFVFSQFANILFNGRANVANGEFAIEFVVPLDIRYNIGRGKISYFAHSPTSGAAFGAFTNVLVGGFDLSAPIDNDGPTVKLYLNHNSFKPGDKTGSTPVLYADIFDASGINTSGAGIGHNIMLVINNNRDEPIVLNRFFIAKPGSYQEGRIVFQLPSLPPGNHELSLRVWDTHNNSTVAGTTFVVSEGNELRIKGFSLSPNPLSLHGQGYFSFGLDEANAAIQVTIEAVSPGGAILGRTIINTVARYNQVDQLPVAPLRLGISQPGIYFARFNIRTSTGLETSVVEKLLITP